MNENAQAPSPTLADRERTTVDTEDRSQVPGLAPAADARLLQQLRQGDAEAGHQFVREYYPGVYRYLLYLTGRPEAAEDLAQETFLQVWRRLETFEGRAAAALAAPHCPSRVSPGTPQ